MILEPRDRVRVDGRAGVWEVVRDTGGQLVVIRQGREVTSAPRIRVATYTPPTRRTRRSDAT